MKNRLGDKKTELWLFTKVKILTICIEKNRNK